MRRLILLGGGHAHLEVLRQAALRRLRGVELILISPSAFHHYSGMAPGFLQRTYEERELAVDLPRLCHAAGARFQEGYADTVDPTGRWVEVDGTRIECDLISADVGSAPAGLDDVPGAREFAIPLRPVIETVGLRARLDKLLQSADAGPAVAGATRSLTVCVVGGGAAGVEIALAVRRRADDAARPADVTLVERSSQLLGERGAHVAGEVADLLAARRVQVRTAATLTRVTEHDVVLDTGEVVPARLTIWLAGAAPTAVTAASALPKDARGYWLMDETLRSVGGGAVWGAGDCIGIAGHPDVPKAGVYAVRAAPVLAANLRIAAESDTPVARDRLRSFVPQSTFLSLLNTADGKALLQWHRVSSHSRWAWWLKDRIDRRFVAKYQLLNPRSMGPA